MSEDSLLERVTAAANERQLSQNTLTAYRRTWLKAIAWAAVEGLALEALPSERAGEFYEEATRGRSASHHLQVKAALSLLHHVLGSTNPFAECPAPKFSPEKTELRYHTASQLGQLLRELRDDRRSYFGHLTYHLATALFFTGCRFHESARLIVTPSARPARPVGDFGEGGPEIDAEHWGGEEVRYGKLELLWRGARAGRLSASRLQ
jgi:site-specific recombinase XerD